MQRYSLYWILIKDLISRKDFADKLDLNLIVGSHILAHSLLKT
jgi:hypothetical protein